MAELDLMQYEKKMVIRQIEDRDIDEIIKMAELGFESSDIPFERKHYESHLRIFPEGQVCIEYDGKIIGSCSSLIVNFDDYSGQHTFDDITDEGFIRNHNPNGSNLYGTDVVVHPDYRYMKIGRRLYEVRRNLCRRFHLKSIVFGGRIPNYHQYAERMSPEEYVHQVIRKNLYDPVLTFQLMNGFEFKSILPNYLPEDDASLKYATLMEWQNPDYVPELHSVHQRTSFVRISAVQYQFEKISSFDELASRCEYYVDAASKVHSDFAVFPESFTMQLLSFLDETVPSKQVRKLSGYTGEYIQLFTRLAIRYSINIVAGSHFIKENDALKNAAFLFRRDGTIERQDKLHISPDEKKWWGIEPGNEIHAFDTDCGKISLLTGYDIQFPELSRMAVDKGAEILFTPLTAADRQGYFRARYCAQARAVENQVFTVIAGTTGNLTHVHHMNTQYARSGIYSPIDFNFPDRGVVSEGASGADTVVIGDVDLQALRKSRESGTVTPLKDRRNDIYHVKAVKQLSLTD